ncbi:MAG: hypothetical protein ABJR46_16260 [Tateyamaria sp.]|uniref:hypothetical protein n=1 Tax=Tateyamaria sp. TaxID=1929288 RepID=UPI00329D11FB
MLHLTPQVILLSVAANSATCLAPQRPFVPNDPAAVIEFADLIRQDFESYITDIQRHFRCLEDERVRAFEEARLVSQDYGAFVSSMGKD